MITKLLNEVNEKIETLNNLVQDKEYFEKLEERIEKVNNYVQKQKEEIEKNIRINNELKNDLMYVLEQLDGYLFKGWTIDLNFTDIREKYKEDIEKYTNWK